MNRWLREGLTAESFWRRAICVFIHDAVVGGVASLAVYGVAGLVLLNT